jgi:hypothetical protein
MQAKFVESLFGIAASQGPLKTFPGLEIFLATQPCRLL